jgi:cobalt/nickel transport protein
MKMVILGGLLLALGLALFLSPFASKAPDGLERVAEDQGFLARAEGKEVFSSPIPDYAIPGLKNEALATALAGLAGTLVAFGLALLVGYGLITRRARKGNR